MKVTDWSDKDSNKRSWSSTLYAILRPVPRPLSAKFGNSHSLYRHSPGDIWRHTLAVSVYHDLAGSALKHHAPQPVIWRRFVRVEHLGVSGVVFYEIPIPPSVVSGGAGNAASPPKTKTEPSHTARGALALRVRETHPPAAPPRITLATVFGDLNDDGDSGMDLDDLMDEIDAKVVYFPAYACTSFVVGQVMSAFLNDCPARRPVPAHEGFSICLGDHSTESPVPNATAVTKEPLVVQTTPTPSSIRKVDDLLQLPAHSIPDTLMLEADDPYGSLCVRASAAYRSNSPSTFLGSFCALRNGEEATLNSPRQNSDNGSGTASTHRAPSLDEPDSESNIATDGQSSPVLQSVDTLNIPIVASTDVPPSGLHAKEIYRHHSGAVALTGYPSTRVLSDDRRDTPFGTSDTAMHSLLSVNSSVASAARRAVSQKYKRLRSNHPLSTRFPCLAKAKRLPQLLYVYRDLLSSESFMDLSGAS